MTDTTTPDIHNTRPDVQPAVDAAVDANNEAASEQPGEKAEQQRAGRQRVYAAIIAFVAATLGYAILPFHFKLSLACAVIATTAGIIGWCGHRGAWRNLAITATVAAATLLLVFAVFWGGLFYVSSSM